MTFTVPARAALAGNPSDMHGGAVLAVPVRALAATAGVAPGGTTVDQPPLVTAALARIGADVTLQVSTTIPRAVGLGGSSALVIAALQAGGATLDPMQLAQLALSIERDDLGIVSGLQDRVVQSFAAPVLVDLAGPEPTARIVMPEAPLRFVVAWLPAAAADSGAYHGSRAVPSRAGIAELARLARAAADAFVAADANALAGVMAQSASVRDDIAPLPAPHGTLAAAVRRAGLSPNSAGSGGAVVAVLTGDEQLVALGDELRALDAASVVETYGPGS